ncbi:hypothetical protein ACFO0N_00810 [Halobium salinum]|uniref:SPW repeat-containing protein n=1 Tax=Halobium salinum TaxID=1364940 RepID=A0ABD5P6I2_9EURY|nr:hypothetical protein [Halobium salinum]
MGTLGETRNVLALHERTRLGWVAVGLALALALVNGYVAVLTAEAVFAVVALTFVVGVVVYATEYWRPVLYLLAAVHVGALGVVWVLDGFRFPLLGAATGALSLALFGVVLALFYRERGE